jgi:hypothetical protein
MKFVYFELYEIKHKFTKSYEQLKLRGFQFILPFINILYNYLCT